MIKLRRILLLSAAQRPWKLTAAVQRLPVLIVGNYRDDESPDLPARVPDARQLSLQRLQRSEIAALTRSMLGPRGERNEIVDYLYGETEGNVFFVVEVVRALAEQAGGLDRISQLDLRRGVVTFGIAEIAKRRVERVPAQFRGALATAAVLGNELERRYERWFLRRLPDSDVSLDLPMSPQLEAILRMQTPGTEAQ